ncbi:MAG: 30S ribosomal protein S17 [Chlamydiota bacterium]
MRDSQRKFKSGKVISDAMDKTVVVAVSTTYRLPKYQKVVTREKKFYAHDESNSCKVGDNVTIMETRPYSKKKCWRVVHESSEKE